MKLYNYFRSSASYRVRIALALKGLAYDYVPVHLVHAEHLGADYAALSPARLVPTLVDGDHALGQSLAIIEYLDETHPQPPLLPADAWERAKLRELVQFIELHLELVARQLYGEAFFGGAALSDANKQRIRGQLVRHIAGFTQLAKFSPYVGGEVFTQADCAAYVSLPLVALASRIALGTDLLAAGGVDWKAYTAQIAARPSAIKVDADRKAGQAQLAAATTRR